MYDKWFINACLTLIDVVLLLDDLKILSNQFPLVTDAPLHQQSMRLVMSLVSGMNRVAQTGTNMSTFIVKISYLDLNQILTKKQQ